MPRDYQLLQPWTQQLLRLARSGKVGTKRKPDPESLDDDKGEDDAVEATHPRASAGGGDHAARRGYMARKWKVVPEALLEPEHKHFEFLAKRRKGLPSLYGPEAQNGPPVPMRKTKVIRTGPEGEVLVYQLLVPEGQPVEQEIMPGHDLADVTPVVVGSGTVVEGLGVANDEGIIVAEHMRPSVASRRKPIKKKGGPGRGKKRVTFTNPDGTTYTAIVPNASKITPLPGQTVKHIAKGQPARAIVTSEGPAAQETPKEESGRPGEGDDGEEGEGSDDGEDDGDDDREEGDISEDEEGGSAREPDCVAEPKQNDVSEANPVVSREDSTLHTEDTDLPAENPTETPSHSNEQTELATQDANDPSGAKDTPVAPSSSDLTSPPQPSATTDLSAAPVPASPNSPSKTAAPVLQSTDAPTAPPRRDISSSPELPLAHAAHSRSQSRAEHAPPLAAEKTSDGEADAADAAGAPKREREQVSGMQKFEDGEEDLLGSLEKARGGTQ